MKSIAITFERQRARANAATVKHGFEFRKVAYQRLLLPPFSILKYGTLDHICAIISKGGV